MPVIVKGTMTKEQEDQRQERLKGKGFEAPCYLQPPIKKPKTIVMK